jgi:putative RecB family exonuclease
MPQYSHSLLSTFEQCRLRYKYAYIDKLKREEDSVESFMGKRFHDVMEKVYAERTFRSPSVEDLKSHFNELWDKNWGAHVFVTRADRTLEDYRKIGLKAVEDYFNRYAPFDGGRILGVEKRVVFDLDGTGRYTIQGYVDRLMETKDGNYEIHDYKTSGTLPDQTYLDTDRQLALYEIAVRQQWPNDVKNVDLVWHYVVFDKEMRSRRTPEQLENVKRGVIELIEEIGTTDEYPPIESTLCRWCSYQNICPLFAHKFRTDVLPSNKYLEEDGVALVNRLAALDAKKRELNAEIELIKEDWDLVVEVAIALAQKTGVSRLFGSDRELTIKDDIDIDYPKSEDKNREAFEAGLKALGVWDQLSSLSGSSFKAFAKKQGWIRGVPEPVADYVKFELIKKATLSRRKDEGEVM